ncbi:hypothetical protein IGI04_006494 [Brassica rapa subsp. trilocularis]|uniref:Uncharacterized protein n=1 Tax=Brassica rapa subsp. trilocularis TaxID=1813537 RepID=A0ABQ7NH34_BRACM|nr:hypothetical protein IGI04_006494 [Brassica rapa subsp. trilocularis]
MNLSIYHLSILSSCHQISSPENRHVSLLTKRCVSFKLVCDICGHMFVVGLIICLLPPPWLMKRNPYVSKCDAFEFRVEPVVVFPV